MEELQLVNYKVIKKIGQGGMGMVFLAEDLALARLVALKVLAPHLVLDQEFMARFRAEARHQARLIHPHITMVYSFQEQEGQAFLVMEYLEGETLESRIQRLGRLSAFEVTSIFHKVLEAMDYAHSQGVLHRDIKPSNIYLSTGDQVKIMDFGIALYLEDTNRLTRTHHIMGTPHYMSPEQIRGEPLDFRSDIYSLGITLFEMVTGYLPFDGTSDYEIRVAQVNQPPPSPRSFGYSDITPALEAVILKALAKEPAQRFATAREFLIILEGSLWETQAFQTPGAGAIPEPVRKRSRLRWLVRPLYLSLPLGLLLWAFISYRTAIFSRPGGATKTVATKPDSRTTESGPKTATLLPATSEGIRPSGQKRVEPSTYAMPTPGPQGVPQEAGIPPGVPPPAPELSGTELVKQIAASLAQGGYPQVKVTLRPDGKVALRGSVKTTGDRDRVMEISREAGADHALDFRSLRVARTVTRRETVTVESGEDAREPELPAPKPVVRSRPALPPPSKPDPGSVQFQFGTPKVEKIR